MDDLRNIIGNNLARLRKSRGFTQQELADQLNYSDKAISKWEHATSLPSIENLFDICKFYDVSLDDLTHEDLHIQDVQNRRKGTSTNQIVITSLSVLLVFLIATILFVGIYFIYNMYEWKVFVWALPIASIILLVFNGIWGKVKWVYPITTLLIWSLLASTYVQALPQNLWMIFILGIPCELIVISWSRLKPGR